MLKRCMPLGMAGLLLMAISCEDGATERKEAPGAVKTTDSSTATPISTSSASSKTESVIPPKANDHLQFCYIRKFYQEGGTWYIDADYIQFLYDAEAVAAARKHGDADYDVKANGDTSWYVTNDYYVVNDNPRLRKLAIDKQVKCMIVGDGGSSVILKESSFEELRAGYEDHKYYILELNDAGIVVGIKEQYVP